MPARIIEPAAAAAPCSVSRPLEAAKIVGYLPEERGSYPAMSTREGGRIPLALRGCPLVGRKRAESCSRNGRRLSTSDKSCPGDGADIQLFGTIVHKPRRWVDEPFRGSRRSTRPARASDPREATRAQVIFRPASSSERLCERTRSLQTADVRRPGVGGRTPATAGAAATAPQRCLGREFRPMRALRRLLGVREARQGRACSGAEDGGEGIENAIERPGLHDAFVSRWRGGAREMRQSDQAEWGGG